MRSINDNMSKPKFVEGDIVYCHLPKKEKAEFMENKLSLLLVKRSYGNFNVFRITKKYWEGLLTFKITNGDLEEGKLKNVPSYIILEDIFTVNEKRFSKRKRGKIKESVLDKIKEEYRNSF